MTPNQTITAFPEFADGGTKTKPGDAKYSAGFVEADVLPAEWLNWLLNKPSAAITEIKAGIESIENELNNLLTAGGETANITDDTQVVDSVRYLRDSITGVLANLATTDKSTLVAAINEIKNSLGTAASKNVGTTVGNVPEIGEAFGTTSLSIVVNDGTGKLKDSNLRLATAATKYYTNILTKDSTDLIQSNAVATHVFYAINNELYTGSNTSSRIFTLSDSNFTLTSGMIFRVFFVYACRNNTSTQPTNTTYFPKAKVGNKTLPIWFEIGDVLQPVKTNNMWWWWESETTLDLMYYKDDTFEGFLILGNPELVHTSGGIAYANGRKELWGVFQAETSGWNNYTVTLPMKMANASYSVIASPEIINTTAEGNPGELGFIIQAKKTDSFVVRYYAVLSGSNPRRICWMIKGV